MWITRCGCDSLSFRILCVIACSFCIFGQLLVYDPRMRMDKQLTVRAESVDFNVYDESYSYCLPFHDNISLEKDTDCVLIGQYGKSLGNQILGRLSIPVIRIGHYLKGKHSKRKHAAKIENIFPRQNV